MVELHPGRCEYVYREHMETFVAKCVPEAGKSELIKLQRGRPRYLQGIFYKPSELRNATLTDNPTTLYEQVL